MVPTSLDRVAGINNWVTGINNRVTGINIESIEVDNNPRK